MPRCPICGAEVDLGSVETPPFCSERCRLVDLGRWLDEGYAVPEVRRADDEDDDEGGMPLPVDDGDE